MSTATGTSSERSSATQSGISPRNENQCARTGCPNPVPRNPRGRPRLYCTPTCRMAAHRYHHPDRHAPLTVEIDHGSTSSRGRPAGQVWLVRLRRGKQVKRSGCGFRNVDNQHRRVRLHCNRMLRAATVDLSQLPAQV